MVAVCCILILTQEKSMTRLTIALTLIVGCV